MFYLLLAAFVCFLSLDMQAQVNRENYYEAFISAEVNPSLISRLESAGVQVTAQYDGFVVACIDSDVSLSTLLAIDGVKHVALAKPLVTCSDSARYYSRADELHQGQGFEMPAPVFVPKALASTILSACSSAFC